MNEFNERRPILILGIGNILLRDEGVGVRVIETLQKQKLPDTIDLVDGGTSGADLIDILADRRKVIIVDAVDAGISPVPSFVSKRTILKKFRTRPCRCMNWELLRH